MKKNASKMKLRARLTMSHGHSARDGGQIRISVEDVDSNTCITEVQIEGDENISKLFRSMQCDCDAEVFPAAIPLYGLRMENKTYIVHIGDLHGDEAANFACDQAERDNPGWEADSYDRKYNGHRLGRDGMYSVTIRRWVQP